MPDKRSRTKLREDCAYWHRQCGEAQWSARDWMQRALTAEIALTEKGGALLELTAGLKETQQKVDELHLEAKQVLVERADLAARVADLTEACDDKDEQIAELRTFVWAVRQILHGPEKLCDAVANFPLTLGDTLRQIFQIAIAERRKPIP